MRNELLIGYNYDNLFSIDTIEDIDISITKNIYSIEDPSKRLSDYTKTVQIPGSKNNDGIFASLFDVNFHIRDAQQLNPDFNPAKKATCYYTQDQHIQISGYCQLTEIIVLENNKVIYELVIYGQNADLMSRLANLTLNDITGFGTFDYTDTDIKNSWLTPNDGSGGYYPMMDRGKSFTWRNGGPTGGMAVDFNSFKPWWFCYEIFSLIMSNAGLEYSSAFITSSLFKSLIMESDMSKFVIDPATQANNKAEAIRNTNQSESFNAGSLSATFNSDQWIFNTVVQDNLGQYNNANGTITVDYDGYWNLQYRYFYQVDGGGSTGKEVTNLIILKRSGVYSILGSDSVIDSSTYVNGSISLSTYLLAGDEIRMCLGTAKSGGVAVATTGTFLSGLLPLEFVFYPEAQIPYGSTSSVADVLPPMKQTDFIMGLAKMFNLYIDTDVNGTYIIEPRDDYFTDDVIDWTDKLDTSKDFTIKPEGLLTVKEINFNYYKNDDDISKVFYESVGETWGYKRLIFDNDFVKETKKLELPFILEPLQYLSEKEIVLMRTLYNGEGQERSPKPIIAFAGGLLDCKPYRYYDAGLATYTTLTQYAYAGFLDTPLDTVANDLCFDTQDIYFHTTPDGLNLPVNGTLYDKYHYRQWNEIGDRDSKYVECYIKLKPYDITTLDFRKIYWIDKAGYRLLEVSDYLPNGESTTLCKFLKLNLVDALVVSVDTTLGDGTGNGGDNTGGGGDSFYGGGGGGDQMLVKNVINGIWQGGNGNVINSSVGVQVTGNENQVGANCSNILIKGDNNTVYPGNSNVTLINCSGLEIDESNVQYIDNIKVIVGSPTDGYVWTYDSTTNTIRFESPGGGGVSDGDKGDIIVSSAGTVWTLNSAAITGQSLVTADPLDKILISEASDSDNLKKVTIQSILDLAPTGLTQQQVEGLI